MAVMESAPGAETVIDGRRYLYFAGTGYLGLQGHAEVIRAACEATRQFGIGSATSRRGFGNTPPVLEVERRAAGLFGADDALYFASGYAGNHVLALALEGSFDAVFVDELSHYCVMEAARLSGRPVFRFAHADPAALAACLRENLPPRGRPLVMSDGVFSARGTIAPAADYVEVLDGHPGAALCLDDAHAIGVLGANGRGTFQHFGMPGERINAIADPEGQPGPRLYCCGTLSKAVGGYGGIVPGSREFIERLKTTSPYYRGASAPPIPAAAATAKALELIAANTDMRTRLWDNVRAVKSELRRMGLSADDTPVPIICLEIGTAQNMRGIQEELARRGVLVAYMASYSGLGPEGALRIAIFSTHTEAMIGRLLDELRSVV